MDNLKLEAAWRQASAMRREARTIASHLWQPPGERLQSEPVPGMPVTSGAAHERAARRLHVARYHMLLAEADLLWTTTVSETVGDCDMTLWGGEVVASCTLSTGQRFDDRLEAEPVMTCRPDGECLE